MHVKAIEVGDEHADLWEGLTITNRHVDGPADVTVGEHAAFGLAVVSHFGLENRIEWFTEQPIPNYPREADTRIDTSGDRGRDPGRGSTGSLTSR